MVRQKRLALYAGGPLTGGVVWCLPCHARLIHKSTSIHRNIIQSLQQTSVARCVLEPDYTIQSYRLNVQLIDKNLLIVTYMKLN